MSQFTKRALVVAAIAGFVASFITLVGVPGASGQAADEAVSVAILEVPPTSGTESFSGHTSPASRGTGATEADGLASEATVVADGNFDGQPDAGGTESIIGVDGRLRVNNTTSYPWSAIGQIEATGFFGNTYICTGWLVDSNTILTSGHCAFSPHSSGNRIAQSAQFFPGRNRRSDPFGGCNVVSAFATAGWRIHGTARQDWAVMQLDCSIGNTVGWLGYFSVGDRNGLDGRWGRLAGYPGDRADGTLWWMSGAMDIRSNANMLYYSIDTFGGQSGSPIFVPNRRACGGPCAMGIHSYGTGGSPRICGIPRRNCGPRITTQNFDLITSVRQGNGN